VSSFSFASQAVASGWAFFLGYSGPPLVTPSAALPSRLSLSPGGGITRGRWQSDPAATATRSNAGKYLARFDISMRVNESIRSGNSQEAPPGGGATAADRHRPDCPALPLPLLGRPKHKQEVKGKEKEATQQYRVQTKENRGKENHQNPCYAF